jgi:DNA-binding MarR family transcriptional regulator
MPPQHDLLAIPPVRAIILCPRVQTDGFSAHSEENKGVVILRSKNVHRTSFKARGNRLFHRSHQRLLKQRLFVLPPPSFPALSPTLAQTDLRVYTRVMVNQCYCIALRAAARKATSIYDTALEPTGVNIAQFSLLRSIKRATAVSLTELGRMTDLDRSTVGRNVKVLERMGLVRVAAGSDQREATVTLDDAGHDVLRFGAPLWAGAQRKIEASLSPATAAHLLASLQSL